MKDCCVNAENLVVMPAPRKDVVLKVCKLCHCRHFEFDVDPGEIGVTISAMG